MARRDYKHRASRRKKREPLPVWIWLLAGYLAGAASVGFLWVKLSPGPEESGWIGARPPAARHQAAAKTPGKPDKKPVPPPDFDFYNLLPDQEVVVPEEELEKPAPRPPAPPAGKTQPAPARKYMLQVGSVRTAREAEGLKARIAFLGLQARVSKANIKGVTWYRVRVGPFVSTAEMQKVRKRLAAQGYQALPIALK